MYSRGFLSGIRVTDALRIAPFRLVWDQPIARRDGPTLARFHSIPIRTHVAITVSQYQLNQDQHRLAEF